MERIPPRIAGGPFRGLDIPVLRVLLPPLRQTKRSARRAAKGLQKRERAGWPFGKASFFDAVYGVCKTGPNAL